jgi:hypothetical protein
MVRYKKAKLILRHQRGRGNRSGVNTPKRRLTLRTNGCLA